MGAYGKKNLECPKAVLASGHRVMVLVAAAAMVGGLAVVPALATDVPAGSDLFSTPPGYGTYDEVSLPADFFGPGSDPFDGVIYLEGDPFPVPGPNGNEEADTIVERLADASLPDPYSSTATVDTQMIALDLKSTSPITVTFDGGMNWSTYDVRVCLSSVDPQPIGWMTIQHLCPDGGQFSSLTPVVPKLIFDRVSGSSGSEHEELDPADTLNFTVSNGFWSHFDPGYGLYVTTGGYADHDCDGTADVPFPPSSPSPNGFFIGVYWWPCNGIPGGGLTRESNKEFTSEAEQLAAHGIYPGGSGQPECRPNEQRTGCMPQTCPLPEECVPTRIRVDYTAQPPAYAVLSCECMPPGSCHVEYDPGIQEPYCAGFCPDPETCELIEVNNGDGTFDYVCRCEPGGLEEACCLPDGSCQELPPHECDALGGTPMGPGSVCTGMQEACCLEDGMCLDADPMCCDYMGGIPQGPGTACAGRTEACCYDDGACQDGDPVCCVAGGGEPQGPGTMCTEPEACCLSTDPYECVDVDPLCCDDMGGVPQGPGTQCSGMTIACCLPDGSCADVDRLCCDELNGMPSPTGEPACLGDLNGNGVDDACEQPCEPDPLGVYCVDVVCPDINDLCLPVLVNYNPATGQTIVLECECIDPDYCHVEPGFTQPEPICMGVCEDPIETCERFVETQPDQTENIWCECVGQPVPYAIEFSLDIGSDKELSDPNSNPITECDEGFDPGDVYQWQSAPVTPPAVPGGRDGFKDDEIIFSVMGIIDDPPPDPPDPCVPPCTAVPVGTGSPQEYSRYFDLDGHDQTDFPMVEYTLEWWPEPLPHPIPEEWLQSMCVYPIMFLAISYDDDQADGWPEVRPPGDVPVDVVSPAGLTYGTQPSQDEVIGATVIPVVPGGLYSVAWMYPIADEWMVHQDLAPNPNVREADDDDVDSLDIVEPMTANPPCEFWLFSPDHEATYFDPWTGQPLDPGGIYEVWTPGGPGGGPVQVIDEVIHLGIPEDADIDAFELVFMEQQPAEQPEQMPVLALIFSVDEDDPLTPFIDESGGLNPNMIYASYLTGWSWPILDRPLDDDIDGLANWLYEMVPPPAYPYTVAWRSVRNHTNLGPLAIQLDPLATDTPVVSETRRGGIQQIEVDFNEPVQVVGPLQAVDANTNIVFPVTAWSLINGNQTLVMNWIYPGTPQPTGLPDRACYRIDLAGSIVSAGGWILGDDTDCLVKGLAGNVNGDNNTDLIDAAFVKSKNGSPVLPLNIRFDLNLDGNIDLIDMAYCKSLNGGSATCPCQ